MLSHANTPTHARNHLDSAINHTRKSNFLIHVFTIELPMFDQDMCLFHVTFKQMSVIDY